MSQIFSDIGMEYMAEIILNKISPQDVVCHLYTNAYDPLHTSILADFVEAANTEYAPINMPGSEWTFGINLGVITALHEVLVFVFSTAVTVEGYYITPTDNSCVLWAERAAAPITLGGGGGSVDVQVQMKLKNC